MVSRCVKLLLILYVSGLILARARVFLGGQHIFSSVLLLKKSALRFASHKVVLLCDGLLSIRIRVVESRAHSVEFNTSVGVRCHFTARDRSWHRLRNHSELLVFLGVVGCSLGVS